MKNQQCIYCKQYTNRIVNEHYIPKCILNFIGPWPELVNIIHNQNNIKISCLYCNSKKVKYDKILDKMFFTYWLKDGFKLCITNDDINYLLRTANNIYKPLYKQGE